MIPKNIYYCWFGNSVIPAKYKEYIASWKRVMPDYDVTEINNSHLPDNDFTRHALSVNDYCSLSNYMRCKVLYENGGIYLDTDVEAVKPFDDLLQNKMVVCLEDDWWINCAVMLAQPQQPYLKECIDFIENYRWYLPCAELETGPRLHTKTLKKYGWNRGGTGTFNDVVIMQPRHFYPYHYTKSFTPECVTKDTYCIHHWAHSWNKKVSVIIPCYNQAQWLSDAIQSVLSQTYNDIEVIVVNDGSKDNTTEIARKFPEVKLIEQENKGLSGARNSGIKASTGGWIITLDADDKIHETFIEKTIGKADIVSTYLKTFGDNEVIWRTPSLNPKHEDFARQNQINCCSIFKKSIWEEIGGFDENMKLGFEDWEFWYRATKVGYNVLVIPEILFFYRKHGESMVSNAIKNKEAIIGYMSAKHGNSFSRTIGS